ncbi:hypothetical protein OOU_Y34scaffold00592g2 [Pyricularia oryzae Y34]|uniref:Uncharacterized protein n=2 Tax=Pyricularia oryzae TaxID=318829 RepID=A0AA97NWB8_PYRO3|nr:hypothetical protein OOU_Y34scaffold00592g2 [Pyricularia oryzae Y34]
MSWFYGTAFKYKSSTIVHTSDQCPDGCPTNGNVRVR